jgi:hypothetical protein
MVETVINNLFITIFSHQRKIIVNNVYLQRWILAIVNKATSGDIRSGKALFMTSQCQTLVSKGNLFTTASGKALFMTTNVKPW